MALKIIFVSRESVVSVEPVRHGLFCAHFHWGVKSSRYNKDDYDRGNGANSIADGKVSHANNASGSAKPSGQPFWASPTSGKSINFMLNIPFNELINF